MQTIFAFKKNIICFTINIKIVLIYFSIHFYKILQINITNIPLQIIKTNFLYIQLHTLLFLIL
ncbi:hypothetical protein C1I88_06500 [Akkermansia muciniphila]|nr:hypothetical protein C1I88_06500 [Akkermansia muciniphila]